MSPRSSAKIVTPHKVMLSQLSWGAICSCGWATTTDTLREAEQAAIEHVEEQTK